MPLDSVVEHFLRLVDLHADLGQECQFEWRTIFVYQRLDVQLVKNERVVIIDIKSLLREMERLVYQVGICIVHRTITKKLGCVM